MLGRIFCDQCTSWRLTVHRPHYAAGQVRQKRVCVECYECDGRARKFLEAVKENSHIRDVLPFDPDNCGNAASDKVDDHAVCTNTLDVLAMLQTEPSASILLGLPQILVLAVDHNDEAFCGTQFFVNPTAWSSLVRATRTSDCTGGAVHIVQFRAGERLWAGDVAVRTAGACCYGKRIIDADYGQWRVGDTIALGCNGAQHRWKTDDVVAVGTDIQMFDFTVPRLDSSYYSSVHTAMQALNDGTLACAEGICIVQSSPQGQYSLLVREDR